MTTTIHSKLAAEFRALHAGPAILLLPNVWDAASARLVETSGAKAVGTSSAAISWARGVPDGEHLGREAMSRSIREICRAVRIPVTVDLEAGYGDELEGLVGDAVDAGAVGINLEDGVEPPDSLCAKLERVRRIAAGRRAELFVNARTDVYLRGLAPRAERAASTLARGQRYRDAGADGFFVPGLEDPEVIAVLAAEVGLPLNLMATPTQAAPARLQALGVRRLSMGTALAEAVWGLVRRASRDFLQGEGHGALFDDPARYDEMNALFALPPASH